MKSFILISLFVAAATCVRAQEDNLDFEDGVNETMLITEDSFFNKPVMLSKLFDLASSRQDARRTIKLVMVNDHSTYKDYFGSSEQRVIDFNQRIVSIVNQMYNQVGIDVKLVESVIWKNGDEWGRPSSFTSALSAATSWASRNLYRRVR